MGEARRAQRVRLIAPAALAAVAIVLLVLLSATPEASLPEHPEQQDSGAGAGGLSAPEIRGSDRLYSGRIEGRVLRDGQGVAADVTLNRFVAYPGGDPLRTRSDATGAFHFPGVPPGNHEVVACGPNGVRVRRKLTMHRGIDRVSLDLLLPAGELTLSGRCMHVDGRPFDGEVSIGRGPGYGALSVSTAGDGRFAASGLSSGWVKIWFRSAAGLKVRGPDVRLPHDGEVRFVVDEGLTAIRGRVVAGDTGDPIEGAEVRVDGELPGEKSVGMRTRTRPDGVFVAAAPLDDGKILSLRVEAEGYRPWRLCFLPWSESFEIRLEPSARLVVRVVEAEGGGPVPFVPVTADYGWLPDVKCGESRLTDAAGQVAFSSISARTVLLSVRGHGYCTNFRRWPAETRRFAVEPGKVTEVELPVVRSALLHGRVTTALGEMANGASLTLQTAWGVSWSSECPEGTFIFPDLPAGTFRLQAHQQAFEGFEVSGTLAPGEAREVDVPLAPGGWVRAVVTAKDTGGPLENVRVEVTGRRGEGLTDQRGQVRIGPFAPGKRWVTASIAGYWSEIAQLDFNAGCETAFEVALTRGESLSGRVAFADGTLAAGVRVRWDGRGRRFSRQSTVTGDEGTFLLRGLPPGDLQVHARLRDPAGRLHECRQILAAGTSDAVLILESEPVLPSRTVAVRVSGPGGIPVPAAHLGVLARGPDGGELWEKEGSITSGRGAFELTGEVADFFVFVHGVRRPTSTPLPIGAGLFGPYPPGVDDLDLVLPPERVIRGRVLDPDGRGLPLVEVRGSMSTWPNSEPHDLYPWTVRTDADGSFRIGGLGVGEVHLDVDARAPMVLPLPVLVPLDQRDVIIRLDRLVSPVITVRDPRGEPVKGASVDLRNPARREIDPGRWRSVLDGWGNTDRQGRKQFSGVALNTSYVLTVRPVRNESDLGSVRIDDWSPRDTEITLPPGRAIAGKALMPDGTPYPDDAGQIWAYGRARGWEAVNVNGGAFEERGFGAGRVALLWIPPEEDPYTRPQCDPDHLTWPITWVTAGDEDIVFTLPPR